MKSSDTLKDIKNNTKKILIGLEHIFKKEDTLRKFIENGGDINTPTKEGKLPVFIACHEQPELLDTLLDHGVELNVKEKEEGFTPLILVSMYHPDKIDNFIAHGADPSLTDNSGQSPLDWALETNEAEAVEKLLPHYPNLGLEYLNLWQEAYNEKKIGNILQEEIQKRQTVKSLPIQPKKKTIV